MKVKCPSCRGVYHETTEFYNEEVPPNGAMVELLFPWKKWGWGKFGDERVGGAEVIASEMQCPNCEAGLAPNNKLLIVPDEPDHDPRVEQVVKLFTPPPPDLINEGLKSGVQLEATVIEPPSPKVEDAPMALRKSDLIRAEISDGKKVADIADAFAVSKQYVSKLARMMREK